ncbi:sodium-dependent glucose transporter 1A-like [Ptychodera flava]|uniref:sodium-dependent glucose transporter 1A-like n=1 Tax=Ptychodera flava TaxID=63121 RepID=UPI00396A60FC
MSRGRPGNDYDDEDVLYEQNSERADQRTLLGNKVKTSPSNTDAKVPRRFLKTCLLCAGFLGLGLCTAILGTSLLDLRSKANGTLQQMFYVVTARNVGVLIGSLVSGHCFDRFDHNFLMASSLLGLAAFGAMVPWCNTMILLFTAVALWGIAIGFLNAGGNIFCVNLWGKKTGPFVQALHFSLGVGALIAPFIAEPFVAYNQLQSNGTNVTDNHLHRPHLPCWVNTTVLAMSEKTHSKRSVFEDVGWMIDTYHLDEDDVKNLNMLNSDVDSGYHARHLMEDKTGGSGEEQESDDATVVTGTMGSTSTEIVTEKPGTTIQSTETQTTQRAKTSAKDDKATTPGKPEITEELSTTQSNDNSSESDSSDTMTSKIKVEETTHGVTDRQNISKTTINGTAEDVMTAQSNQSSNASDSSDTMTSKIKGLLNTVTYYIHHTSQIQKAYMIIAMYNVVIAIPFFWFFYSGPGFFIFAKRAAISTGTEGAADEGRKVFRLILLIALFLFFFLYKGIEESFGAYIYTFAKCIQLEFSSLNAVHLNAVFWGTFALGRLLAICIAAFLHPKVMLIPSMFGMVVSLILLAVLGNTNSGALWSGTVLLGLSMSSVFPAAIAWAERYILLTGKAVASFFISSSVAGILIPWLLGILFQLQGITVLMKLLVALGVALFLLYIIMQILASRQGERPSSKGQNDNAKQLLSALEEEVVELESIAANNNPSKGKQNEGDKHKLSQAIRRLHKDLKHD